MDELIEKCLLTDKDLAGLILTPRPNELYAEERDIAKAQLIKALPLIAGEIKKELEELGDFDYGHGDATTGDVIVVNIREEDYQSLFNRLGVK